MIQLIATTIITIHLLLALLPLLYKLYITITPERWHASWLVLYWNQHTDMQRLLPSIMIAREITTKMECYSVEIAFGYRWASLEIIIKKEKAQTTKDQLAHLYRTRTDLYQSLEYTEDHSVIMAIQRDIDNITTEITRLRRLI